jgi:uncharacterized protein YdeI (YjbR/CyaY-like superfamily)
MTKENSKMGVVNTEVEVPEDIAAALSTSAVANAAFAKMPPSHKRRWIDHIIEAKKPETRASRIAKMVEQIEAQQSGR